MSGWHLRIPILAAAAVVALGLSVPARAVPVAPAGAADSQNAAEAWPDDLILAANGHPGFGGGGWRGRGYYNGWRGRGYYNGWRGQRYRCPYYGCNYYGSGFYIGLPFWGAAPYYYNSYDYGGYDGGGYAGYGNAHVRWCLNRYRSYNPRTDTFMGYDGYRHRCRGPY